MNNHCTDLATSRKLKEIGCPQRIGFVYNEEIWGPPQKRTYKFKLEYGAAVSIRGVNGKSYSAYLLSELIDILGDNFVALEATPTEFVARSGSLANDNYIAVCKDNKIQAISSLILKLHSEGILKFNQNQE